MIVLEHATNFIPRTLEQAMKILALDLGKFNSMACVFNPRTKKNRTQLVKSERGYFKTLLKTSKPDLVVMEACSASGWVHDLCQDLGSRHSTAALTKSHGGGETLKEKQTKTTRFSSLDWLGAMNSSRPMSLHPKCGNTAVTSFQMAQNEAMRAASNPHGFDYLFRTGSHIRYI